MDNIVLEGLRPPPSLLPFQKPPLGLPTILGNLPISENFRTPPSPPPPPSPNFQGKFSRDLNFIAQTSLAHTA